MLRKTISAALIVSTFFVVIRSESAGAAPDKTFEPAGNWVVNRIAPPSGGSPYCTLARRFSGNMIITFARNTDGEGTVAVDFQQPLFEASETYRVALQAGYGLKREFLTRPASANAIVLRTGQDPEFFEALAATPDLTLIFDNGRYGFSMPDFTAGEAKLSGCIGTSPAVMPRAPTVDTDSAAVSDLRREIDALKQENASIAASLRDDGASISQARSDLSGSAENDALLRQLSTLEAEKNALVDKLQNERARQQQELQDEETLRQALTDQKQLREMLESERRQRAELESALSEKSVEAEKRGELRARIEQLEISNRDLKALRETLDAERSKRMMAEKELQAQQAKSAATLEDQERLRSRVSELENENASLQQTASQFETTRIKLLSTESRASDEQARRLAAEKALQDVQMTAAEKEARIGLLQKQMQAERAKLEEAEVRKQAALMTTHREELARLTMELEKLRAVEVQKEQLSQTLSAEQARRASVERTLMEVQMTASEKEARIAKLQIQMAEERKRLESAEEQKEAALMKTHRDELARLNIELQKLRAVEVQKEQLSQTLSAEQARRAAVEKELTQVQMTASEKEARIAKLEAQMVEERQSLERAEGLKQAALMRTHQGELARLNTELQKLRAVEVQKEQLSQTLSAELARRAAIEKELTQVQMTASEKEARIAKLQAQMVEERQSLERAEEQKQAALMKTHKEELSRLAVEMEKLRAVEVQKEQLSQTLSAEQARRAAVEKELSQVQMTASEKEARIAKLQTQMVEERRSLERAEEQKQAALMQSHKAELARLAAEMEKLRAVQVQKEQLSRSLSAEQARREAIERTLKEVQMTASEKEARIAELRAQMVEERRSLERAEEQKEAALMQTHKQELARLTVELEKLRAVAVQKEQLSQTLTAEQARREAVEQQLRQVEMTASEKEARIAELQAEMETERQSLERAEKQKQAALMKTHKAELARLNSELETLRALEVQNEELSETLTAEQARRAAIEKQLRQVQMTAAEKEAQIAELQAQMVEERQSLERAEEQKEAALVKTHTAELTRLNGELEKLRAVEVQKEQLSHTLSTEQARREAIEKQLRQVQMTAAEKEARIAALQAEMETERQNLTRAEEKKQAALMKTHSQELARLNTELEQLRRVTIEKEEVAENFATEQARRTAAERELNATRAELSEKQTVLTRLDTEKTTLIQQLREQRQEAAAAIVADASAGRRLDDMARKLSDLEQRNSALMTEVQTAKAQTREAEQLAAEMSSDAESARQLADLEKQDAADRRELKAMLEAEKARREKLEDLAAKGGSAEDKLREIETQMADLATRNTELETALSEEKAKADAALAERTRILTAQLELMKADNVMLAEKLAREASEPAAPRVADTPADRTDTQTAELLAETKSSLATALAERDEYRTLLQRERLNTDDGTKAATNAGLAKGLNARIAALETERVDLIRQLEYERGRIEEIAAGREPPLASGRTMQDLDTRLKGLEAERAKLKKQLEVAQQDVLNARQPAGDVSGSDVAALLSENKQLQAELAASARSGKARDANAMEAEIASLRAQNTVLSHEINKRMAEVPSVAAASNAAAAADHKMRSTKADMDRMEQRFDAVEAENVRLARELATARTTTAAAAPAATRQVAPIQYPAETQDVAGSGVQAASLAPLLPAPAQKPLIQPIVDPVEMAQAPAEMPQPALVEAAYAPPPAVAQQAPSPVFERASLAADAGPSGRDIESYLRRAGVPLASGIEKVRTVSTAKFAAFRWDTGAVFGTAEQSVMANRREFEAAIDDYLSKTESRCSGAFDTSFDVSKMRRDEDYAVADVACVMPDGHGAGAAILFFYKDGLFNVIAHEGEIGQFEQAMQARDTLARFLPNVI